MYLSMMTGQGRRMNGARTNMSALAGIMNPALGQVALPFTSVKDPTTFLMGAGLAGVGLALGVGAMGALFFLGTALEAKSKLVKVTGYALSVTSGVGLLLAIAGLIGGLMQKKAAAPQAQAEKTTETV